MRESVFLRRRLTGYAAKVPGIWHHGLARSTGWDGSGGLHGYGFLPRRLLKKLPMDVTAFVVVGLTVVKDLLTSEISFWHTTSGGRTWEFIRNPVGKTCL